MCSCISIKREFIINQINELFTQWGVTHLADNKPEDTHFYQISVYTGMRSFAGTKSKVGFALVGEKQDTGLRILSDNIRYVSIF